MIDSYYTSVAAAAGCVLPRPRLSRRNINSVSAKTSKSFGMYGYDATLVGIKAMEQWIKANGGKKPSRADVVRRGA